MLLSSIKSIPTGRNHSGELLMFLFSDGLIQTVSPVAIIEVTPFCLIELNSEEIWPVIVQKLS